MRWGERLEFAAEVGRGDFVYFAPFVPHQEFNVDESATVDFVVIRNDPFMPGARLPTAVVAHSRWLEEGGHVILRSHQLR